MRREMYERIRDINGDVMFLRCHIFLFGFQEEFVQYTVMAGHDTGIDRVNHGSMKRNRPFYLISSLSSFRP
jgi:hypothetical protein